MKQKQPILRKEIVSGKLLPANELIRVVKTNDGNVFVDSDKKANGRGVYIQPKPEAIQTAKQKKLLERSLKTKIPSEVYDQLIVEINENWD
ncbi:RNase P modulator RnpM [Mesoplasma lactucae]|uniref:RNA-binding protein n=1 Tax=Mesoplasma lactucae ATCC 49193 TaxID=81460 RepID=A0A291IRZ2_9MOLU|nr:YlxR family protein [Mesoplasma lactucae]ATG97457.1 RNA-binding protein [Mesoplasma lactucae ATCC 49193]ATZ20088.1 RNA-binding protein [Mesoplasma lactucae ATCC 49193]MCL8216836.1 hypothetical protein [Mesoplasma lactucae ATCC 49193]